MADIYRYEYVTHPVQDHLTIGPPWLLSEMHINHENTKIVLFVRMHTYIGIIL